MGPVDCSRMRTRMLPSGRPPEEIGTLVQDDPTWELEYAHFKSLCSRVRRPIWRTISGCIACCSGWARAAVAREGAR